MLLSIIIPIFNAGRVLNRTLDSVMNQGLECSEFELILVNDGSADNSLCICKDYEKRYPDIVRVISKANGGVSEARNVGMKKACGDYLYFMDADDYLMPGGFRYLIDNFLDEHDILSFFSSTISDFGEKHIPTDSIKGNIVFEGNGIDFLKNGWQTFVWNQFYKRIFIQSNNILFQDVNYSEDIYFNLEVWTRNPKVRIVSSCIYKYIVYKEAFQASKRRDNAYLRQCIKSHMRLFSYISELNCVFKEKYKSDSMELLFQSVIRSFMSRVLSSDLSTAEFKVLISRLVDLDLFPMRNIKTRNAKVISFMMHSANCFPIYKYLYKSIFIPYILPKLSRE